MTRSGTLIGHYVHLHRRGLPFPPANDGPVRPRHRRPGGLRVSQDREGRILIPEKFGINDPRFSISPENAGNNDLRQTQRKGETFSGFHHYGGDQRPSGEPPRAVASRHGQNIQLTHCARKAARGFVFRRDAETQSYCARKAAPPFFRAPSPRSPHLCVFPTDKEWDNWDGWDFRGSFHVPLPHRTPKNRDKGERCIHVVKKVEKCYSFLIYR